MLCSALQIFCHDFIIYGILRAFIRLNIHYEFFFFDDLLSLHLLIDIGHKWSETSFLCELWMCQSLPKELILLMPVFHVSELSWNKWNSVPANNEWLLRLTVTVCGFSSALLWHHRRHEEPVVSHWGGQLWIL